MRCTRVHYQGEVHEGSLSDIRVRCVRVHYQGEVHEGSLSDIRVNCTILIPLASMNAGRSSVAGIVGLNDCPVVVLQVLKESSQGNLFSRVWWYRLFQHFEHNVQGTVPRSYQLPLPGRILPWINTVKYSRLETL